MTGCLAPGFLIELKDGYTVSDPSQTGLSDWQDGDIEFLDDNTHYWSSMKNNRTNAWSQYFGHGGQNAFSRTNSYRVRAVRKVII
jgi:hypothetical protein